MPTAALDGPALVRCLVAGTWFLRRYRTALNALNVFPVPDGDTGTNLLVTARAALEAARPARSGDAHAVGAAAARGALLGARGNSGVIFSQLLRGFAEGIAGAATLDAGAVAAGCAAAAAAARDALATPVEGTMLSVASAVAGAAADAGAAGGAWTAFGERLVEAANAAVDRTPEQLAVLRESGVVDAGAAGLSLFLEGPLRFADGTRATAYPRRPRDGAVFAAERGVGPNRFCTEFVLAEATVAAAELRAVLAGHGDSVLVGGAPPLLKLHLHTPHPAGVRAALGPYGRIAEEKVEDMDRQYRRLVNGEAPRAFGTVALVPGEGFGRIARTFGADALVRADDAPPVEAVCAAIDDVPGRRVYVVAAGAGAAEAARAAAERSGADVRVVPVPDVVAALAAVLALGGRAESPPDDALAAAAEGVGRIAVRTAGPEIDAALAAAAGRLGAEEGGLLTLYYGGRQTEDDVRERAAALAARYPQTEVEYYAGGVPGIEYWVSFER